LLRGAAALSNRHRGGLRDVFHLINLWFVDPHRDQRQRIPWLNIGSLFGRDAGTWTRPPSPTCSARRARPPSRQRWIVTSSASKGPLPDKVRPLIFTEYGVRVPVDPSVVQVIDMERASNLAYKRWQYFACNTTTVPGVPFSGDASDAI